MFETALVTGATSGIGEALCRLLAAKKINLIITGRDAGKLQELAKALPVKVEAIQADLNVPGELEKVIDALKHYRPELIVNNAGMGLYGEIFNHSTKAELDMLLLNNAALVEITLEGAKALRAKGKPGVILNVSSAASLLPFPCFSIYSATKAFVNQLSLSLDAELQGYGIRVLAACPGMVRTNFRERASGKTAAGHSKNSMSPEEAAEHIWWQIEKKKPFYVFNWKYRFSIFIAKYFLPKSILMRMLRKNIEAI